MERSHGHGFTLIELIVTIAMLTTLAGIAIPVYNTFFTSSELNLATEGVVRMLRRAQTYSRGSNFDSGWGVRVQVGSATLYKGSSYATRDTSYDENILIASSMTPSGISEISFSKLTAQPNTTGTITFANQTETRTITVNAKGTVSY